MRSSVVNTKIGIRFGTFITQINIELVKNDLKIPFFILKRE